MPIAIDFAIPLTKDSEDDTQFISFSLGFRSNHLNFAYTFATSAALPCDRRK